MIQHRSKNIIVSTFCKMRTHTSFTALLTFYIIQMISKPKRLCNNKSTSQFCMKILPYVGGAVVFIILLFALYVHSLPPKISKLDTQTQTLNVNTNNAGDRVGATFEEAMQQAEMMNGGGVQVDEDVVNLDGDSL